MDDKKQKILIADDNPHFSKALKFMILDSFNDQVESIQIVRSGEECHRELSENMYDVVFMDINMPGKNGIEVTKEITQLYRNLVIIAVSFHSDMKYVIQMIEAGARTYIIKDEINKETLDKALAIEYSF